MDLDYEGDVVHQGECPHHDQSKLFKFYSSSGWLTKSPPLENRKQIFNQSLIQPVSFFYPIYIYYDVVYFSCLVLAMCKVDRNSQFNSQYRYNPETLETRYNCFH